MRRLLLIHLVFLIIALLIAFVLVPLEKVYFGQATPEWAANYYRNAITLGSYKAWGIAFTWFLGLSCGRLILKALAK